MKKQLEVISWYEIDEDGEEHVVEQVGYVWPLGNSHGVTYNYQIEPFAEGREYLWLDNHRGCVVYLMNALRDQDELRMVA